MTSPSSQSAFPSKKEDVCDLGMYPANALPSGLTESELASAISDSGYPLQIEVGRLLANKFEVEHEWAYLDSDTGEARSIDILASRRFETNRVNDRVYPSANILIECKRSTMPLVFFIPEGSALNFDLPVLAGLRSDRIEVLFKSHRSTWTIPILALVADTQDALQTTPPQCFTFSKAKRTGKKLELCGSEAYNNLIRPLVKACMHLQESRAPKSTYVYFDMILIYMVAVIDGPMYVSQKDKLKPHPWVRVLRHEHVPVADGPAFGRKMSIDVVHKSFLETFLNSYLIPSFKKSHRLALKHHIEIAEGEARLARGAKQIETLRIKPIAVARDSGNVRLGENPCIPNTDSD